MWVLTFLLCAVYDGQDTCVTNLLASETGAVFFATEQACKKQELYLRVGITTQILQSGGDPFFLSSVCVKVRNPAV